MNKSKLNFESSMHKEGNVTATLTLDDNNLEDNKPHILAT